MTTARWRSLLGAGVLCVVLCTAFIALGQWQWRVAFADQQRLSGVVTNTAVPLDERSHAQQWLPRTSIGALVTVTGRLDQRHSFITSPRPTSRGLHPWVVTPLRLSDGTAIAVVTGFTSTQASLTRPDSDLSQSMSVTARLQPSEDSPAVGAWNPASPVISTSALVDRWPYPVLRDGYLVVTQSLTMNSVAAPTPRFTSAPSGSIGWRSLAYAFQWWSFAAFAVFVFIRQVASRPERAVTDSAQ